MEGWIDGRTDGWMDGRTDGWMDVTAGLGRKETRYFSPMMEIKPRSFVLHPVTIFLKLLLFPSLQKVTR
jgi:hypothetical protein